MQRLLRREATLAGAEILTGMNLPAQQAAAGLSGEISMQSDCSWGPSFAVKQTVGLPFSPFVSTVGPSAPCTGDVYVKDVT